MTRADEWAIVRAATPGKWAVGYSHIVAVDKVAPEDAFDASHEGHSLERDKPCDVCGEWTWERDGKVYQGHGCRHWDAAYEAMSTVAWVPSHHGDTPTGSHLADAAFIAHFSPARVAELLAENERMRKVLLELEWDKQRYGSPCLMCQRDEQDGHLPGCAMRAALGGHDA